MVGEMLFKQNCDGRVNKYSSLLKVCSFMKTPKGLKPATDRSSATQACTAKRPFLVQSDYGTPGQMMSASCHLTALKLNWTPSRWCNCRPAMFLTAPLHCFYLLRFSFMLYTTAVLTTSTAHTNTYTAVRYCSITSWHLYWTKDERLSISTGGMVPITPYSTWALATWTSAPSMPMPQLHPFLSQRD